MPDAYGNFKGIAVNGAAWDRIFGKREDAPPLCTAGPEFLVQQHAAAIRPFVPCFDSPEERCVEPCCLNDDKTTSDR